MLLLTNKQISPTVAGSPTIDEKKNVDHVISHPVVIDIPVIIQRPTKAERYGTLQSCVGLQEQRNRTAHILVHHMQTGCIQKWRQAL